MKTTLLTIQLFSVISAVVAFTASPATAVINGDFETGDFTGWTVSGIGGLGDPIDPSSFISVTEVAGNKVARFKTGEFADGLFVATLEQTLSVNASEPILSFDLTLPTVLPDPTGTGSSPFVDGLFVSLDDGTDFFELLLVDQFGIVADPFGTAPGSVALGSPTDPNFDFNFSADLSSLAGENLRLFIDLIQEDDGFLFDPDIDNVLLRGAAEPIPEPVTAMLGTSSLIALGLAVRRRR